MQRVEFSGLDYLAMITRLTQRCRAAHPTEGLYEAADFQWWWRKERRSDTIPQLFWLDDAGDPVAAAPITDWGERASIDPILLPGSPAALHATVAETGLAHAKAQGYDTVSLEVDPEDKALARTLLARGFSSEHATFAEAWLAPGIRPAVSALAEGYTLWSRAEAVDQPYHNVFNTPDMERRLNETSLYRADLDLVVTHESGDVAGYGLFWFDPTLAIGMVEPMRTVDAHQRRGLARHIIAEGINRLFELGAERVKICWEPDNDAAVNLYRGIGFEPVRITDSYSGPTG